MSVPLEAILFGLHARISRSFAAVFDGSARRLIEFTLFALAAASIASFMHLHLSYVAPFGPPQCFVDLLQSHMNASNPAGAQSDAHIFRVRILPRGLQASSLGALRDALTARMRGEVVFDSLNSFQGEAQAEQQNPRTASGAEAELSRFLQKYMRLRSEADHAERNGALRPQPKRVGPFDLTLDAARSTGGQIASSTSVTWRVEAELSALLRRLSYDVTAMYKDGDYVYASVGEGGASAGEPSAPYIHAVRSWVARKAMYATGSRAGGTAQANTGAASGSGSSSGGGSSYSSPLASLLRWCGWWYGSFAPGLARARHRSYLRLHSFHFAHDRGLLSLSPTVRDALGVTLTTADISADDPCLGSPASRALLRTFAGYDTAVLNGLLLAANGAGYVQAEANGETFALSHAQEVPRLWSHGLLTCALFKVGTLCSAVFLVFATSSLVSFILAQTQQRMLLFTLGLQHRVRSRLPLLPLVASHLLESLAFVPLMLGVLFFLFEFFGDQLLAFLMTVLVWGCELWSIVSCRTQPSLLVFPRVFGVVMTLFHVYFLTYPFGYKYTALQCAFLVLAAVSFCLWSRYELPALTSGALTTVQPRAPEVALVMTSARPLARGIAMESESTPLLSPRTPHVSPVRRSSAAITAASRAPSDAAGLALPAVDNDLLLLGGHTPARSGSTGSSSGVAYPVASGSAPGSPLIPGYRSPAMSTHDGTIIPPTSIGRMSEEEERIVAGQLRRRRHASNSGSSAAEVAMPPLPPDVRRSAATGPAASDSARPLGIIGRRRSSSIGND